MNYPVPFVSAVVKNDRGDIFLVEAGNGWSTPGWPLEGGLSWLDGLARGVEGLGIRFAEADLVAVISDPSLYVSGRDHHVGGVFLISRFEGEPWGGRWFPAAALPESLSPRARGEIRDAVAFRGEVTVR